MEQIKDVVRFDQQNIRRIWHNERWYFAIVDVISALTESNNPGQYWRTLKSRFKDKDFLLVLARCINLPLIAADEKQRLIDCADIDTIATIVHVLPPSYRHKREKVLGVRCGIYAIVNTINQDFYIGSSIDVDVRFQQHRSYLNRQKHHARLLQAAWNEYGEAAFEFRFLEMVENEEDLAAVEQVYLTQDKPSYNFDALATNSATFPSINEHRIYTLLAMLRESSNLEQQATFRQEIQLAIDFGIINPGPKYHLLIEAEMVEVDSWDMSKAFLMSKEEGDK